MTGVYDQLFAGTSALDGLFVGVAVGIVTNVRDPDKLGRVKLKLPWLADEVETSWARVAVPAAGKGRGLHLPLEVDDEVLVAFAHGSPADPFVLGALWSAKDSGPEPADDKGPAQVRSLRSRSGHIVRLSDVQGSEKIEILDKSGRNTIVVDTAANTVTITADTDLVLKATKGKVAIEGNSVEINGKTTVSVKGKKAEVTADAQLTLKGSMVNIN